MTYFAEANPLFHQIILTFTTKQQADFLKHHAQVEKDIAMFQQSMSPNTPSGGATTQVGAVFGALAGQGVYAVQNEIE